MTNFLPGSSSILPSPASLNRQQEQVIEYLKEENRVLRELLGKQRLQFTDLQRRRLAERVKTLGRQVLEKIGCLVTPDTPIAEPDRQVVRRQQELQAGSPPKVQEIHELILSMVRSADRTGRGSRVSHIHRASGERG